MEPRLHLARLFCCCSGLLVRRLCCDGSPCVRLLPSTGTSPRRCWHLGPATAERRASTPRCHHLASHRGRLAPNRSAGAAVSVYPAAILRAHVSQRAARATGVALARGLPIRVVSVAPVARSLPVERAGLRVESSRLTSRLASGHRPCWTTLWIGGVLDQLVLDRHERADDSSPSCCSRASSPYGVGCVCLGTGVEPVGLVKHSGCHN